MKKASHRIGLVGLCALLGISSGAWAENLDNRVRRLEQILDNRVLVDLLQRMDSLQSELRELRGELEAQRNEIQQLSQTQQQHASQSDARLQRLEQGTNAMLPSEGEPGVEVAPELASNTGEGADVAVDLGSSPTGSEKGDYDAALSSLKQGDYVASSDAFTGFLERYPKSDLADNAKYWLGESYYIVRAFESAAESFQRVMEEHPDSGKGPDARLKLAFSYHELNRRKEAIALLEGLIKEYPDTSVSRLAAKRLARLK